MAPQKFPEGSGVKDNPADRACMRAIDSLVSVIDKADRIAVEIDNQTMPGVVRIAVLSADDSVAHAVRAARDVSRVTDLPSVTRKKS